MSDEEKPLPSWDRPNYEEGGGRPFLLYVLYGAFPPTIERPEAAYRSEGLPRGIGMRKYDSRHPQGRTHFLQGYNWERFRKENPALALQVWNAPESLVIIGEPENPRTLDYLRDVIGLVTHLADHGAVCVNDPQTMEWWTPAEWRARIFEADGPAPHRHVAILTSEEKMPGYYWFHTRGMRKFGRPDLSLHDVLEALREPVLEMFERLIKRQVLGAVVPEAQELRMASLPPGLCCFHEGDTNDPDFNNAHIEIVWPE